MAELPEWDIRWVEVWGRYDWIAYYEDKKTWQRYSKYAHIPIEKDELCRYGYIYKVEHNWEDEHDFTFKILSVREDKDENDTERMPAVS